MFVWNDMYCIQDQGQDMGEGNVVPESSRYNPGTYPVSGTVKMSDDSTANV